LTADVYRIGGEIMASQCVSRIRHEITIVLSLRCLAMKRRIVLVDVHDAVRELLCRYLERMPEYEVVGVAGTGLEAIRVLKTTSPHRAIIGLLLPQLCAVTK
jgi:hypothetical protein